MLTDMMHIIEVDVDLDDHEEFDLDKTYKEYRALLNAAYKRVKTKVPAPNKKERKLIRKAIEVGIGIADEMYDEEGTYTIGLDYRARLDEAVLEVIGETNVGDEERKLIRKSIEAGIQANIKDIMVREGRYY